MKEVFLLILGERLTSTKKTRLIEVKIHWMSQVGKTTLEKNELKFSGERD